MEQKLWRHLLDRNLLYFLIPHRCSASSCQKNLQSCKKLLCNIASCSLQTAGWLGWEHFRLDILSPSHTMLKKGKNSAIKFFFEIFLLSADPYGAAPLETFSYKTLLLASETINFWLFRIALFSEFRAAEEIQLRFLHTAINGRGIRTNSAHFCHGLVKLTTKVNHSQLFLREEWRFFPDFYWSSQMLHHCELMMAF